MARVESVGMTVPPRVARYVDPAEQVYEDAMFLPTQHGELFCVVHRGEAAPRAGVVMCQGMLAEEHKMYGTHVLTARAFAKAGLATIRFHYRGTGHSSGAFDDTTLDTMLEDTAAAVEYLKTRTGVSALAFCGGRWGGLVAALTALQHPGAPLILWEPVMDGRGYFREIFRASQISALAGGASALTVTQAVERVAAVGVLDTLGYPIHRALYNSAEGRSLTQLAAAGARPVLLVQISPQQAVKPEFARLQDALVAAGCSVEATVILGEGAWAFVDSPMPSPRVIVEASAAWLTRTIPAV
jgi:alpha/beta superfamily hydrolase